MRGIILQQFRIFHRTRLHRYASTLACSSHQWKVTLDKRLATQLHSIPALVICQSFHASQSQQGKIVPFMLSDIGEGIREVVVKEWFVEEGDHVSQFDQICEVQSDKASVTITSRYDGVVKKKYYKIDETALVGDPLVDIELSKGAHDSVAHDQVDDITGEHLTSQVQSGLLDSTEVIDSDSDNETINIAPSRARVLATPAVRRIASENNINLLDVVGTGKEGRVLKEDLLAYIKDNKGSVKPDEYVSQPSQPVKTQPSYTSQQNAGGKASYSADKVKVTKKDEIITLRGIRKAMAQSMNEALKIPHFGYCDEVDMTALVQLRKELKGSPLVGNVPFSYMPVILKACSLALKEYPVLNSSLLSSGDQIVVKSAHNIGFAMDSPDGLIVPNIKNVQNLSVLDIAEEMHRLISLGENGKLGMDDLSEGTFTISNIGSIGGTYAKPVILPPQVAIGALGKIQTLPRFDEEGNLIKAHVMNVSWSADHRVIEGAQMARFSNLWRSYLENPATLVLKLR